MTAAAMPVTLVRRQTPASRSTLAAARTPVAIGLILFVALAALLWPSRPSAFGLGIAPDGVALTAGVATVGPLLGFFLILIAFPPASPATTIIADLVNAVGRATGYAISLVIGTGVAVLLVRIAQDDVIDMPGSAMFWVGMMLDYVCTALFAIVLRRIVPNRFAALSVGFVYVVTVILAASRLGGAEWYGVGTVSPPFPSDYTYWLAGLTGSLVRRLYWFALLASGFIVTWRSPDAGIWPAQRLTFIIAVALMLTAAMWLAIQAHRVDRRYPATTTVLPTRYASIVRRPTLTRFALAIDARQPGTIAVRGLMRLVNRTTAPLDRIILEDSQLLQLEQIDGPAMSQWRSPDGRLTGLHLAAPLLPDAGLNIAYTGRLTSAGPLDRVAGPVLASGGTFLQSAMILPLPRTSACAIAESPAHRCRNETWFLTDSAPGHVTVRTAPGMTVAGTGSWESTGSDRYAADIPPAAHTMLTIAMAPFATTQHPGQGQCPVTTVMTGRHSAIDSTRAAAMVCAAAADLARVYGPLPSAHYTLLETPVPGSDASSFLAGAAFREPTLALSRSGMRGVTILDTVITHEIAHQYWGFRLIPCRGPGQMFVLESIAQFTAFKSGFRRGLDPVAVRRWLTTTVKGRTGSRPLSPIWLVDDGDWQTYMRAPLALLTIDAAVPGGIDAILANLNAGARQNNTVIPSTLIAALIARLPAKNQPQARKLLGFPSADHLVDTSSCKQ